MQSLRLHTAARAATLALLLAAPTRAQTTTLAFTEGPIVSQLQGGYGDRVAGPTQGGFTYPGTGSYTPGVIVSFGARENGQFYTVQSWYHGYNDLLNVIWCSAPGAVGGGGEFVVTFTADPGRLASLHSFDVGNWGAAFTLPYLRVVNEDGTVLHEQTSVPLQANTSTQELNVVLNPPPVGRILSLRIGLDGLLDNADNVGLDNIVFGELAGVTGEVGASYCGPAVTNSSAGPAALRVWGSTSVAANDVRLVATGLPVNSFGFFLASRTQGHIPQPGSSQGVLCLGGSIGRFVGPGQVVNTSVSGNFELTADLTALPTPNGLVAAQAGQTWNFTAWFRDANPTNTSNFTDAVSLLLQ